jgi:hypothetical protein
MSTPVKKSSTIILIGDKGGRKADFLLLLYAFCTGKTASDFSKIEAVPSPTKTIDRTSLYSFTYSSGLQLQVVDAPECAPIVDTAQIASFKDAASSLVTMVDAIVVLADDKQEKIGAGATSMLDMLSSTFPRPIEKNIFLVLTYQGGTASTFEYEKGVWPEPLEWLAINQVLSVESVANLRLNVKDDRRLVYESKYNDAINQVRVLFACMEQSIVQAWDMRDLYLEAAKTESQLFDTLGVSGSPLELSKRKEVCLDDLYKYNC